MPSWNVNFSPLVPLRANGQTNFKKKFKHLKSFQFRMKMPINYLHTRLEREADFLPPKCDLLIDIGSICIGKNCKVPKRDLTDLIHLAGGHTVNQIRIANVILGHDYLEEFSEKDDVVQVSEKWLLDSLQQYCPLPFVDYMIQK